MCGAARPEHVWGGLLLGERGQRAAWHRSFEAEKLFAGASREAGGCGGLRLFLALLHDRGYLLQGWVSPHCEHRGVGAADLHETTQPMTPDSQPCEERHYQEEGSEGER